MRTAFIIVFILQGILGTYAIFNHDSNWKLFFIMAIIVAFFTPENGEIAKMLYNDHIVVNVRYKRSFVVPRPKVIIIKDTNCAARLPPYLSFHVRFDIFDLDDIKSVQTEFPTPKLIAGQLP
jgi:hypothetical protein